MRRINELPRCNLQEVFGNGDVEYAVAPPLRSAIQRTECSTCIQVYSSGARLPRAGP